MSHSNLAHRRTHNLLLISKLFGQRDQVSPFTLVLDTLEQPAKPLLREYVRRAILAKCHTILLGFETVRAPSWGIDTFSSCYDKTPGQIAQAVTKTISSSAASTKRYLILVDSLHTLATLSTAPQANLNLATYLMALLQPPRPQTASSSDPSSSPTVSLVAVYHADIPLPPAAPATAPATPSGSSSSSPYTPTPLTLLSYLATTIMTLHSPLHVLAAQHAAHRSLAPPQHGLDAAKPGILISLPARQFARPLAACAAPLDRGVVLEVEHRRKSGRGVFEWYFLPTASGPAAVEKQQPHHPAPFRETVVLLDDHPLFRPAALAGAADGAGGGGPDGDDPTAGVTFNLNLTDRQRREREGVVLPYFDAQRRHGPGEDGGGAGMPGGLEGGRILYDMGAEDDFDDEEDEI